MTNETTPVGAPASEMEFALVGLPAAPDVSADAIKYGGAPTAEEMEHALTGLPQAQAAEPAPKPRKVVRFVESEREKVVPLQHPVECEDIVYDRVVVRRLNVADFHAYFSRPEGERGRFPCFFDARGDAVPDEVLDALSIEDSAEVGEAYQHFLPASFRADPAP